MERKRPRGPIGKSCLTCKRRHKKCDQGRPNCARCTKGAYECVYGDNERGVTRSSLAKLPRQVDSPDTSPQSGDSTSPECVTSNLAPESSSTPAHDLTSSYWDDPTMALSLNVDSMFDNPSSEPQSLALVSQSHTVATTQPSLPSSLLAAISANTQIPPSIAVLSPDSWRLIDYVMSQYDNMLQYAYFKPIRHNLKKYREMMLRQLQGSSITRRTKLISFKVCEAVIKGDDWRYHDIFNNWIKLLEQEVHRAWREENATSTLQGVLANALEVSFVKTMLVTNQSAYECLRNLTPTFLRTVFSDPTLWPDNYETTSVPLARILTSSRCELGNFVLMDSLYAMAYGLPQFVEYDTSVTWGPGDHHGHPWTYGCPVDLQLVLVDINSCRDKSPNARDWREIEERLVVWQPESALQHDEWESWMSIAWMAVQESWRHALLAYLYMAVCGVSSDDSRVQHSVRQIFQILETVRKPEQPVANIQFFAQYFIAGVCARTEKHRVIARQKLADTHESRVWLVGGGKFVPVLDHLWHGAGAGGQPIKWSDYMQSRELVLPVV